jgi:hypothetical protein
MGLIDCRVTVSKHTPWQKSFPRVPRIMLPHADAEVMHRTSLGPPVVESLSSVGLCHTTPIMVAITRRKLCPEQLCVQP